MSKSGHDKWPLPIRMKEGNNFGLSHFPIIEDGYQVMQNGINSQSNENMRHLIRREDKHLGNVTLKWGILSFRARFLKAFEAIVCLESHR